MKCTVCHKVIVGSYLTLNGINIHADCFKCNKCDIPIEGEYIEHLSKHYHQNCYLSLFGLKCNICGNYLNGKYIIDDWGNKSHPIHKGIQTIQCKSCGVLIQENKLKLCSSCTSKIISSNTQINECLFNVTRLLKKVGINLNTNRTKIDIVTKEYFNNKSLVDNQMGLALTNATSFMGQKMFKHNIYILNNLPKLDFEGVLAHELLHTWLNENEIKMPDYQTEGFCNLGSYLIFKNSTNSKAKNRIKNLINDPTPIYGIGFRKMKNALDKIGWTKLIKLVKSGEISKDLELNNNYDCSQPNKYLKIKNMKIYVTTPNFDNIGEILSQLKLNYSSFPKKYDCDILFLNCGTSDNIKVDKLNQFVKKGGVLYASDLTSATINDAFPNIFNFAGNIGEKGTVEAEILDGELQAIIGSKIEVYFDMGVWSVLDSISQGKVILKSLKNGKPLMVQVNYGKGKIFYTCFHNHVQANEKEAIILKLFVLKQISQLKNSSIKDVSKELNIELSEYAKHFESSFLDDYKVVSKDEKITNKNLDDQKQENNWGKLSKSETNLVKSNEDKEAKMDNDNIWSKL